MEKMEIDTDTTVTSKSSDKLDNIPWYGDFTPFPDLFLTTDLNIYFLDSCCFRSIFNYKTSLVM